MQRVVQLAGTGAAAGFVGGGAQFAGLCLGKHSNGDRAGVIGQGLDLLAVDIDGVAECQLFHVCRLLSIKKERRPRLGGAHSLQDAADGLRVVFAADA